jgi:hypothetical protein
MIIGTDPHMALYLAEQHGAKLRADAARFRLVRLVRARARARPEEATKPRRAVPRPERAAAR